MPNLLKKAVIFSACCIPCISGAMANGNDTTVVVVVGAPGEAEFGEAFGKSEGLWAARCREADAAYHVIGTGPEKEGDASDLEQLKGLLKSLVARENEALWLVLLGHGTFDGAEAKYNLRGPDVSAEELADWLGPKEKNLVLVNTTSSSAPFLALIAGPGRIVITATKSGGEIFYTRFGNRFAEALASPEADLDEDGQTSLLETFLHAARSVADSFQESGLLATEHPLIDDNGDKKGTRADWFEGVRVVKEAEDDVLPDGLRAHQVHLVPSEDEKRFPVELRRRRNELELEVTELRFKKADVPEEEYYAKLETLFLEIAEIYREAEETWKKGEESVKSPNDKSHFPDSN